MVVKKQNKKYLNVNLKLFSVLELAEGGELFEKIIEKTKFNEAEAKLHFYQMASAIQYLHSKG